MGRIPAGTIPGSIPQDHVIELGGVGYHYREYPATGPDVVLLHGFASSTYTWEEVAPLLQEAGYHVWALDMKGFGWSDKPRQATYSALTFLEEVNAWMEALGLERVVFVGNSLGGAIAWLMALEHPERVGKLVLVDSGGYAHEMPFIIRLARLPGAEAAMRLFAGRWVVKRNMRQVFYAPERITPQRIEAYYDRMRTPGYFNAQVQLARSLRHFIRGNYTERLGDIDVPTLIIWGREDTWIPLENAVRFRRDIPGSLLVVIPECGHVPQEERPEPTARAILDFLAGDLLEDTGLVQGFP